MDRKDMIDHMDSIVKRVTVVQGGGDTRRTEVIYETERDDEDDSPNFKRLERSMRSMLKAQLVAAQEAYQRHLDSAERGGTAWMKDAPGNFWKAGRKAVREMRKSMPFGRSHDDEEEGV